MWNILKAAIAAVIKTNNNQEITGAILQNTLRQIVNSLGANATLAGFATPETSPGTPDGPVFWIAGPGYYDNFGNVQRTVTGSQLAFFIWSNESWQFKVIDFAISSTELTRIESIANWCQAQLDSLTAEDVTGPGVQSTQIAIALKKNIGSEQEPEWETLSTVVLDQATVTKAGLMSANDKIALATLPDKQNVLISGTNIKTIGGLSILGSGDISIANLLNSVNIAAIYSISPGASGGYIIVNGESISSSVSKSYSFGSIVSLQAVANTGYTFDHWAVNGVAVKNNPFSFQIVKGGFISAIFNSSASNIKTVTYSINPNGSGEIFANGSNPSSGDNLSYNVGTTVELTAAARSGYLFNHWEIDGVNMSTSATYSFTVSANHTVTAVFEQNQSEWSVQEIYFNENQGSVTANGITIASADDCGVNIGNTLTLVATPKTGYIFDHWERNIDGETVVLSTSNTYSFTVSEANYSIRAVFAAAPSNLKVYLTSNTANTTVVIGSKQYVITQNVETVIDYTEGMTLEASNSGRTWIHWWKTSDDTEYSTSNPLTLTGLTADLHLSAIFN